jgi:hypothetical protein
MSYSELQELESLLSERLCLMRLKGASIDARLLVARWLANVVIQKAAAERKGLDRQTLYLPQYEEVESLVDARKMGDATAKQRRNERRFKPQNEDGISEETKP